MTLDIKIVINSFKIVALIVGCIIFISSWFLANKYKPDEIFVAVIFMAGLALIIGSTWSILHTLKEWN